MSPAKLMAVIDGGSGSEAALIAALDLGRRFSAQVELLHVDIDGETAVPMVGEGMSGAAVEQLVQSLRAEGTLLNRRSRPILRPPQWYSLSPPLTHITTSNMWRDRYTIRVGYAITTSDRIFGTHTSGYRAFCAQRLSSWRAAIGTSVLFSRPSSSSPPPASPRNCPARRCCG